MEDEMYGKDHDEAAIDWYEKKPDPTWLDQVARLVDFKAVNLALDIGCGAGGYAHAIARAGVAEVIAVDVSRKLLHRAQVAYPGRSLLWVGADAHALPFAEGRFEFCLMRYLLHHVRNPLDVLREAVRILAPEGLVLVESAALDKLRNHYDCRIFPRLWEIDSQRYPSREQIERWLVEVGCSEFRRAEIVRKRGERRSLKRVLEMSRRMVDENRGPSSWKLLSPEERKQLHQLRASELPKLYPDGLVPREWWSLVVIGRKGT